MLCAILDGAYEPEQASQGLRHLHRNERSASDMRRRPSHGKCLLQASQAAGAQKRQRKGPSWADDPVNPVDDEASKTIFDDWDDYVTV